MKLLQSIGIEVSLILGVMPALASDTPRDNGLPRVPVRVLAARAVSPETNQNAAMPVPRTPQPTLPGGKLPQYQLRHRQRELPPADSLSDARVRFLLALPERPLLVEAAITIDGQPFRMARERRIQKLLSEAAQLPAKPETETITADLPAAANADTPPPSDGQGVGEASANPAQLPPYALASSASETARRYAAATGQAATAEELRWLLTNRVDGPVLLLLNDNFQRFRATQRPVFHVLDRDRSGDLSASELENANDSFAECDLNRDGVVDSTELAEVAADPRFLPAAHAGPGKLIFLLGGHTSSAQMQQLAKRYGGVDLPAFAEAPPDLKLMVAFDTQAPEKSFVAVSEIRVPSAGASEGDTARKTTITLPLFGAALACSGLQAGVSDQVSIGAIHDGYPMLPVIDPNDDGRFTARERRDLKERLRTFDRNRDGSVTAEELRPTIRLCFGLGPLVHQELALVRSVHERQDELAISAPEWFVRMDRNKDNDLSRGEFPGTDEQFAELDADMDSLVSAEEAVRFEKQAESAKDDTGRIE